MNTLRHLVAYLCVKVMLFFSFLYRTECQLRQYSCRIQKEIKIVKYEPCTDAPSAVYGGDARQQDILSDGTGVITIYGLIGKYYQKYATLSSFFSIM